MSELNIGDWVKVARGGIEDDMILDVICYFSGTNDYILSNMETYNEQLLEKITSFNQLVPFKVDCKDKETSAKVQKILFDNGFTWCGGSKDIMGYRFFFLSNVYITWDEELYFINHKYKEIPVELILWLGGEKEVAVNCSTDKEKNNEILRDEILKSITNNEDVINHPSHYTYFRREVINVIEECLTPEEFKGYLKGNMIKYRMRAGIKGGTEKRQEDLDKSNWYQDRLNKLNE